MLNVEHYPGSGTFLGRVLRLPLSLIPKSAIVPILQGPLRGKRWIAGSGIHRLWLGSYEPFKMTLAAELTRPATVVFDIGANVGIYTLLFADRVGPAGRVVAFEPAPRNVAYLRKHLALNSVSNVEIVDAAVSDAVGSSSFDDTADSCAGRLESTGALRVRTTTIDHFVQGSGLHPSLIKIDVEGAEGDVLHGALKTLNELRPTILIATHSHAVKRTCTDILVAYGYDIQQLENGGSATESDELIAQARPRVNHSDPSHPL
jgi:FkbM family methyltransferase